MSQSKNTNINGDALEINEDELMLINDYFEPKTKFALAYQIYNGVLTPVLTADDSITLRKRSLKKNKFPLTVEEMVTLRDFGTEFVIEKIPLKNTLALISVITENSINYEELIERIIVDYKTATDKEFNINLFSNIF